ncbi:MAG: hypothetical protein WDM84_03405 [Bauldia sp.]
MTLALRTAVWARADCVFFGFFIAIFSPGSDDWWNGKGSFPTARAENIRG